MSRVLFINGNVHGHINPTIALTKELVGRGEEVVYFSTEEFREKIEAAGARFRPYGGELDLFMKNFRPSGNHPFYTLLEFMLKMDEHTIPLIQEKIQGETFDYVIHDAMLGGGKVLAYKLGLPAICSCTSFAMDKPPLPSRMLEHGFHPQLDRLYEEMDRLSENWDIKPLDIMDVFFKKEELNIVYTSKVFQPDAGAFDESFRFVGPSIDEARADEEIQSYALDGQKVVYISMGTINNNCADFYGNCMEAFSHDGLKVVMSVGNKVSLASLGAIPENFIVRSHVPQLAVLKKTDAFISHGGLNSVSEALYYGVPMVAIPQANDQPVVVKRLAELGAGIGLKMKEATPQILRETVYTLLSTNTYKDAAQKIGSSFKEAGGYKAAADYIMEYVSLP